MNTKRTSVYDLLYMPYEDCAVGAMHSSSVNASKKQNIDVILLVFV